MDSIVNYFFPKPAKGQIKPNAKPTCGFKFNKQLQYGYENTSGLSTSGLFLDLTQPPIGGRPIMGSYVNYVRPPTNVAQMQNYKFGCRQPTWTADCY
jgi:hypothetical protein